MSESWRPGGEPPATIDRSVAVEFDEARRAALWSNRLRSVADVEAQKQWQESGMPIERQARGLFDALATRTDSAKQVMPVPYGLPDTDALLSELAMSASDPSYQPGEDWRETIEGLRRIATPEGEINALALLRDPEATASTRLEWWQKEIAGLLRYTLERDFARLRDTEEPIPPVLPEEEQSEQGEPMPDALPPSQEDEMRTSMDPLSESKEGEPEGYFSVHPFWGGYYRENVYEIYRGGNQWMKDTREYKEPPEVGALAEERVFRGKVRAGVISPLPLPYGFSPDVRTLKASGSAKLVIDQHGCYSIDAQGAQDTVLFTLVIGKPERGVSIASVPPTETAVSAPHAGAEARSAIVATGTTLERATKIKKFVKETLTYSNDDSLNAVYAKHKQGYFAAIEQHKKADCDVANAYYINLLSAAGIRARMVTGHYVKNTDHKGAAIMNGGSRHAWTEVWDEIAKTWVRFDATPPKDPTLDKERPDEKSEDEAGEQPGDYGEQEAPQLSEEELEEWREKLAKAERDATDKTPEQLKDEKFAKAAECTVEQAMATRAKINEARRLRDRKGRVVRDEVGRQLQAIVESNFKEVPDWKGPVPRSEGEHIDDIVMVAKDALTGNANPLGYAAETTETKLEQRYGGFKVYWVPDRSGSMNDVDPTTGRPKKDEQQLFGFLFLDATYGFSAQTERAALQNQLVSPLAVESMVVAFQAGSTQTIRPLEAEWGPKEQVVVWQALEQNIGGGTPAHLGLTRVREQIEKELAAEEKDRRAGKAVKPFVRMVVVTMDGGVDDLSGYLAEQKRLEALGADVSNWGMTESAQQVADYPNGVCVQSAREMVEPVMERFVKKAQALKLKQG